MMPVIDSKELLTLTLVFFVSGVVMGALGGIVSALLGLVPKGKNRITSILIALLRATVDFLLFFTLSIMDMLLFSAYGGGSVRMGAIVAQIIGFTAFTVLKNRIIQIIKTQLISKQKRIKDEK